MRAGGEGGPVISTLCFFCKIVVGCSLKMLSRWGLILPEKHCEVCVDAMDAATC